LTTLYRVRDAGGIKRPSTRQRRPDLKVLFTTGYSRSPAGEHENFDLTTRMIGKPFSIDTLASRVRAVLDGTDNC